MLVLCLQCQDFARLTGHQLSPLHLTTYPTHIYTYIHTRTHAYTHMHTTNNLPLFFSHPQPPYSAFTHPNSHPFPPFSLWPSLHTQMYICVQQGQLRFLTPFSSFLSRLFFFFITTLYFSPTATTTYLSADTSSYGFSITTTPAGAEGAKQRIYLDKALLCPFLQQPCSHQPQLSSGLFLLLPPKVSLAPILRYFTPPCFFSTKDTHVNNNHFHHAMSFMYMHIPM